MNRAGVRFAEKMQGEVVAAPGSAARSQATLRAMVIIDSLEDFLSDPQHKCTINGSVQLSALTSDWLPAIGEVRLFTMGDKPGERIMHYHVEFMFNGVRHALSGNKFVYDDRGLDAWRDITTLYTAITREESDGSEQKLWNGPMRLTFFQAALLLTTLRGRGDASFFGRIAAVLRFSLFFISQVASIFMSRRRRS